MNKGKVIVLSAPSGCGKSTIIHTILDNGIAELKFSVSATNRKARDGEIDGVDYHFLSTEQFRDAIADDCFIEYEEVYPGRFYGTLKSEVANDIARGENIVLDIDVKGAINVKKIFGNNALTIFILPPDIETLRERLITRGTDAMDEIERRVSKAEYEISYADQCDVRIINDNLENAVKETARAINAFLAKQ